MNAAFSALPNAIRLTDAQMRHIMRRLAQREAENIVRSAFASMTVNLPKPLPQLAAVAALSKDVAQ